MYLKEIRVGNIRPFSYKKLKFKKGINVVFGENGTGKTTVLEAIHLLSLGKSFKTAHTKDFIKNNEKTYKITGTTNKKQTIQIKGTTNKKQLKVQEKIIKKISKHIKTLPIIINTPDTTLYEGDQNKRRQKNLNKNICLISPNYLSALKKYNTIIKQRNAAIKSKEQNLSMWNQQIVLVAKKIWKKREEYIKKINKELKKLKQNQETEVNIEGVETKTEKIKKQYLLTFQKDQEKGHTTYGPHKDKINYFLNKQKIKNQASQGERALFFATLKKAEAELIKKETSTEPIILLDDIFSKTDPQNQNKIISLFIENKQTIITHTKPIKTIQNNICIND